MGIRKVFRGSFVDVYQGKNEQTGVLGDEFATAVTRWGDSFKLRCPVALGTSFKQLLSPADAVVPREFDCDLIIAEKTEGFGQGAKNNQTLLAINSLVEILADGTKKPLVAPPKQQTQAAASGS